MKFEEIEVRKPYVIERHGLVFVLDKNRGTPSGDVAHVVAMDHGDPNNEPEDWREKHWRYFVIERVERLATVDDLTAERVSAQLRKTDCNLSTCWCAPYRQQAAAQALKGGG